MTIRPSRRERSSGNDGKSGAGVMRFWSLRCRRWNSYSDQNAFTRAEQCGCYLGAQFHLPSLETLSWTASSPHNQPSDSSGLDFGRMAGVRGQSISSATAIRSEEHTSELQSLMRISYAVFCLKKKTTRIK